MKEDWMPPENGDLREEIKRKFLDLAKQDPKEAANYLGQQSYGICEIIAHLAHEVSKR